MPARRALIVDRDKNFVDRLRRCLESLDLDLDVARSRREALEYLEPGETAVVFLAVERPKKSGFKAFTEVKQKARNVPVVLATSTVPMAELLMHQKLRLHADAYIDKRTLSERELLKTLGAVLQLNLEQEELTSLAEQAEAAGALREGKLSSVDPALVALLGNVGANPDAEDAHDDEVGYRLDHADDEEDYDEIDEDDEFVDSERLAALREEVRRLKSELSQAKRSASSSPFSTDYLALSEKASAEKRSNARLKREHASRARQVKALRAKLLQVAERLLKVERLRDQLLEQVPSLQSRGDRLENELGQLQTSRDDLTRRLVEETGRRESLARQHAADLESFENRLAEESLRVVEAEKRHTLDLAAAEQSFLTARAETIEKERTRLEDDRRRMKLEYEAATEAQAETARDELAAAVEKERLLQDEQRRQLQQEHAAVVESQAQAWREQQAATVEEHRRLLDEERQRWTLEHQAALKAQSDAWRVEQRQAVEGKETEWQRRLDELKSVDEQELNVRSEDHQRQLAELRYSMEQVVGANELELATLRADLEAAEQLRNRQIAEFEGQLEALRQEHAESLQAASLEHEKRRDQLREEHECTLATHDERHRNQLDRMAASHEQALAERDRKHAEAIERTLAETRKEHHRDAEARLDDFESTKLSHQENLAKAEQLYKEQVELLEKLHAEQLDRQKIQHEREQDRLRTEHSGMIAEMEHSIREEQELAAAVKQAEWQTRLEEVRREQAQALATERGEMQVLIDALEAVKDVDRAEDSAGGPPVDPTEGDETMESSSTMLREIAEEMDRLGDSIAGVASESVELDPAHSPGLPADERTRSRSD